MDFKRKRWIYLVGALIAAICTGIGYTWSVFQSPLIAKFGWNLRTASLIFTFQVIVSTMTPMMLGQLQQKLGLKKYLLTGAAIYGLGLIVTGFATNLVFFLISFSVGVGLGTGMLYPSLMGYSVKLFPDKSGIAAGLMAGFYGTGAVIWAPTAAFLYQHYGIMNVYKILGIAFAVIITILLSFLKMPPADFTPETLKKKSAKHSNVPDLTWQQMVRTPKFYMLLVLFSLGNTSGLMIMAHASSILQDGIALSATKAAVLVGMVSMFNTGGRFFWGFISDAIGRYVTINILFITVGLSMVALSVASGVIFMTAIMAVGFCYGGFATIIAPTTADIFGQKHVTVNYGFLYFSFGIGAILGPQIAAYTKSISGGYLTGFLVVSVFSIAGLVLNKLIMGTGRNTEKSINIQKA
ncbi:MAG: OFA family MFS transporter [Spirochaetales bacterium]|nr:OFA family MFS transporter [Spirochaetales bacterium]